jgi:hypothetical protein
MEVVDSIVQRGCDGANNFCLRYGLVKTHALGLDIAELVYSRRKPHSAAKQIYGLFTVNSLISSITDF